VRDMARRREYTRQWKARNRERVRVQHRDYMRTWRATQKRVPTVDTTKCDQLKVEIANIRWQTLYSAPAN
jgi:hypothetical protein